jgi:DNA-binding SARP family transcriptional activator/predicted ATPase
MEQRMSSYTLRFLGSPRIEIDNKPHAISRRKALALLAYLAVSKQVVNRETVATLLWSDSDNTRALSNLRTAIWVLNKELRPDWAILEGDMLQWNRESDGMVDVRRFRELVEKHTNQKSDTVDEHQAQIAGLSEAIELYRDDFMSGFAMADSSAYEDWLFLERENLRQLFATALENLIDSMIALGDYEAAIPHARRWISLDPLHEPAHQMLMRLYAYAGQYAAAHRQLQQLERLLDDELGVPLSSETQALYREIEARRLTPPTRITTISAPMIQTEAPALSSLPMQATAFFGRQRELAEISNLIKNPDCRLLTLFGPGGVGKTRLAIEAAQQANAADGVYFINLTPVTSPLNITSAIVQTLKCYAKSSQDEELSLKQFLATKKILLVLDNFEYLLAGVPLLSRMLESAPNLMLLVTSRERLNLQEEWVFDTEGLDYPDSIHTENWQSYGAIQLFINSARHVDHDFKIDPFNQKPIVEICKLAGGMPLAIELAASWVDMLDCNDILREIQNSLDFLATESRSLPQRQRSLRAVFEYTWQRLAAEEQNNLSCLSIFKGPFTLDAAQKIAGTSIHDLRGLMNKALLRRPENLIFDIHELIRQFAHQKLDENTLKTLRDSYMTYYGQFAQDQIPDFQTERQPFALYLYDRSIENMAQAWQWALDAQRWDVIAQLAETFAYYYMVRWELGLSSLLTSKTIAQLHTIKRDTEQDILLALLLALKALARRSQGHQSEILALCQQSMDILKHYPQHIETALPITLITSLYTYPGAKNDHVEVFTKHGLELCEQHGKKWLYAVSLFHYGFMLHNGIRYAEVPEIGKKALAIFQELGQPWGIALAYDLLAEHAITLGDNLTGIQHLENSLPYIEKLDAHIWASFVRNRINMRNQVEYDTQLSLEMMQKTLHIYRHNGDRQSEAYTLFHLAWTEYAMEDLDIAERHFDEALVIFRGLGKTADIAWSLVYLGKIAQENRQLNLARQYIEQALQTIADVKMPWAQSGADFVLGHIALAEGNWDAAYQSFVAAVRSAWAIQSITQVLRHMAGLAMWYVQMEEYEKAVELAIVILAHSARGPRMSKIARQIIEEAHDILGAAQVEAIQARPMTLSDTMAQVLSAENMQL